MHYELHEDGERAGDWVCWVMQGNRRIAVLTFTGTGAEQRARRYVESAPLGAARAR